MKQFKPNLYPNNATDGTKIDWKARIKNPEEWRFSEKYDGIRMQIFFDIDGKCAIHTRSLKGFRSFWVQELEDSLDGAMQGPIWVEGELWCKGMMFSELQHFFLSQDVTTEKAKKKTVRDLMSGKFEGRTFEWLTTYDHPFRVMLFDMHDPNKPNQQFYERFHRVRECFFNMNVKSWGTFVVTTQLMSNGIGGILNFYEETIAAGGEGIILKHEQHIYKYGRNTLKEAKVFKMIDEFNEYTGVVTDVLEGTIVDPWVATTTNELGYSRTSKLQEDRMPSGRAKGFEVEWEGKKLTVTLKGFTNDAKQYLLKAKQNWIGREITFLGKPATKINGVPRQAKYIKK